MDKSINDFLESINLSIDTLTENQKRLLTKFVAEVYKEGKKDGSIKGGIVGGILGAILF